MIYPISRPVTDDFTFDMFKRVIKDLAPDVPTYYMWSNPPSNMKAFLEKYSTQASLAFIGIKDLLDCWEDFNFWHDTQQKGSKLLSDLAQRHPNTKFVFFTSLENLDLEIQEPNVHIVPWGGDYVNQRAKYLELEPVLDKNFESDRTFISLNRQVRDHRIVNLSYLFGSDYAKHGVISYLGRSRLNMEFEPKHFLDRISWEFSDHHEGIREKLFSGYEQILEYDGFIDDEYQIYQEYGTSTNDNIGNFNTSLRPRYRNSFVEIVSESSFTAPSFMLTEKTAHSFFGCNFPIILSGKGAIQHLRDVGFDMFDDYVDHTYDTIENPFDRIITAIEYNQQLLLDSDYAKKCWKSAKHRFENNIEVYKKMFDWYEQRARQRLTEILENT